MAEARITYHDQIVINGVMVLAAAVHPEPSLRRMVLAEIKVSLPRVTRGHPDLTAIFQAAQDLVYAAEMPLGMRANARVGAELSAARAVKDFALKRMGMAQAARDTAEEDAA